MFPDHLFPACAGMNRGSGATGGVCVCLFPACAGMNRWTGYVRMDPQGRPVPRMRGDEPSL